MPHHGGGGARRPGQARGLNREQHVPWKTWPAHHLFPALPPQVMHDCHSDCEALFYQHGIRAAALWDTQVGVWGGTGGQKLQEMLRAGHHNTAVQLASLPKGMACYRPFT